MRITKRTKPPFGTRAAGPTLACSPFRETRTPHGILAKRNLCFARFFYRVKRRFSSISTFVDSLSFNRTTAQVALDTLRHVGIRQVEIRGDSGEKLTPEQLKHPSV